MSHTINKRVILPEEKKKTIPKEVWQIFHKFTKNNLEIYLVGGGVKSILQGEVPIDCDFTTNAKPEVIQALFEESYYDNNFGTVGIPLKTNRGEENYEITTYRTEWGYSDKRRPDKVAWGEKLEEDLKRRDFTFDAIVIGPVLTKIRGGKILRKWDGKSLELIDLFGGQKDFDRKIVRAVGEANARFSEDALRMLRAIRFASQLGFIIEKKTFTAIKKNASLIKQISAERIREELLKILSSNHPYEGYLFFKNSGLAEIILPEIEKCFGVQQKSPGRHHIYDVGTHLLLSLKYVPLKDPIVRLATLLHDIGKPLTRSIEKDGTITFHNHEIISTSIAYNIGKRLRLSKNQLKRLTTLVRWHQFTVNENQSDKAIRRFIRRVGKENLEYIIALRVGDRLGGGARETSWRLERFKKRLIDVQKQPFTVKDLKIDGHDIMKTLNIKSGPLVGKILETIFTEVEEGKVKNDRDILLKKVKEVGAKH
ncbi:MAG TPA: HD domain-containing protein [Candidatus Bathyarchaeia archaeon]|nr:HD domain-containing protein [Candidatus Bathyarchaeia archaeon]